jgi:hypothetical protein
LNGLRLNDRGARDTAVFALLQLEIYELLRFAERAMNGLVVVPARPGLRIAPKIYADEPGVRSTRNNLSLLFGP